MRCSNCGTEVKDGAHFCPACGRSLDGVSADATCEPVDEQGESEKTPSDKTSDGSKGQRSVASFLMRKHRVGKCEIPMIALILAAVVFTLAVAGGLVKAYEVFLLPTTQQTTSRSEAKAKEEGSSGKVSGKKGVTSKKNKATSPNDDAHEAYQAVVSRYQDFAAFCDSGKGRYDEWAATRNGDAALDSGYIYNVDSSYALTGKSQRSVCMNFYYAYADLNGDGVDELLIGEAAAGEKPTAAMAAYCFANGKAEPIVAETEKTGTSEDSEASWYKGFMTRGEGHEYEVCQNGQVRFVCYQDWNESSLYFNVSTDGIKLVDAIQMYSDASDKDDDFSIRTVADGGEPKDETAAGIDAARARVDAVVQKHPTVDMDSYLNGLDWQVLYDSSSSGSNGLASGATQDDLPQIVDKAAFIATARSELQVPDDSSIDAEVEDTPLYWEGADRYVWEIAFYKDGDLVAGAECDESGHTLRDILVYTGNQ